MTFCINFFVCLFLASLLRANHAAFNWMIRGWIILIQLLDQIIEQIHILKLISIFIQVFEFLIEIYNWNLVIHTNWACTCKVRSHLYSEHYKNIEGIKIKPFSFTWFAKYCPLVNSQSIYLRASTDTHIHNQFMRRRNSRSLRVFSFVYIWFLK